MTHTFVSILAMRLLFAENVTGVCVVIRWFAIWSISISEYNLEGATIADTGILLPGGGGDLLSTMPGCVCPKVKDMGPFSASRE